MSRAWVLTFVSAVCLVLAGCRTAAKSGITIAGSTSVQPFAERLAELYMRGHGGVAINVQGGGSSAGIRAVQSRICQIGMSSRALTEDEKALHEIPIALDAIALIVNARNPVRALTLEQARAVFSGRIRNWRELGGPDLRITVITREEGSGTRASFEEKVMAGQTKSEGRTQSTERRTQEPGTPSTFAADALVQDSNGAVREIVATDPAAIGYISFGLVDNRVAAVALEGVAPSDSTIRSHRYPVVRKFLFLTREPPSGAVKRFIDYVLSPEGQQVLADEGLTPIGRE